MIATVFATVLNGCTDDASSADSPSDSETESADTVADGGDDTETDSDTGVSTENFTDCEALGLTVRPFDESGDPEDGEYDQTVGDLMLDTLSGRWRLSRTWTGCDNHIFILLNSQLIASDFELLIDESPPNTHYFFISMETNEEDASEEISELAEEMEAYLATLDAEVEETQRAHLHFVTTPGAETGWISALSAQYADVVSMIGIDRFQRARDGGYPGMPGLLSWREKLEHARYLSEYYNYESDLADRLEARIDVKIVTIADHEDIQDEVRTVSLEEAGIDADTLASYSRLEIELTAECPGDDRHPVVLQCPEWDTVGSIRICDDETCEDEGVRIFKWITPYANEGHWVRDISPLLPYFTRGEPVYLRMTMNSAYKLTVSLRFSVNPDAAPPRIAEPLYENTSVRFDATYNEEYSPVTFTPPDGTTRVLFYGIISGHGMSDSENCAEFCTHQHLLTINGTEFPVEFSVASTGTDAKYGCAEQVSEGVTPNQPGTWTYDRAGWCPGLPVTPWTVDITDAVELSGPNTAQWSGAYEDGYPPGNGGYIEADTYLVFFGEEGLDAPEIETVSPEPACISPVVATVRDFQSTHPDFDLEDLSDDAIGVFTGALESELQQDADGNWKPVYAYADDESYGMEGPDYVPFTTGENFAQWFSDVPEVNYTDEVEMEWTRSQKGTALFDHWVWYPLKSDFGWGDEGNEENKDYTVEIAGSFIYQGGEFLRFSAESDLWVFVNHHSALDLGGAVHDYLDREIDLDASAEALGLTLGETYDLHIFGADRNHTPRFTLEMPDNCETTPRP